MRSWKATAALTAIMVLSCCEREPGPSVPLKSFALHDVQGLHGGLSLWACEDRVAIAQIVEPSNGGLWEKRYSLKLTNQQWAEVEQLVGAHHFQSIESANRAGVPDEARPTVVILPKVGTAKVVSKWANDRHEDFDPVYNYLMQLCHGDGKELVHEGKFDWDWRPEGFENPWK